VSSQPVAVADLVHTEYRFWDKMYNASNELACESDRITHVPRLSSILEKVRRIHCGRGWCLPGLLVSEAPDMDMARSRQRCV
jgi:hypothetical protein